MYLKFEESKDGDAKKKEKKPRYEENLPKTTFVPAPDLSKTTDTVIKTEKTDEVTEEVTLS